MFQPPSNFCILTDGICKGCITGLWACTGVKDWASRADFRVSEELAARGCVPDIYVALVAYGYRAGKILHEH